jgi:ABC-2 type transport system ATP-binding protein
VDGTVRIERERGHEFIAQLVEAFPGQIDSVAVSKPTLEDVFIRQTGHHFWEATAEPAKR